MTWVRTGPTSGRIVLPERLSAGLFRQREPTPATYRGPAATLTRASGSLVRFYDDDPATSVAVGRTWIAEGRYETAETWLLHAVSLEPDDPVLWEILARFYLEHTIISEERGISAASKLAELSPGDHALTICRGGRPYRLGRMTRRRRA